MPKHYNNYIYIIARLYSHTIMKTFSSDGLFYVYKTYKVIKLFWHVSLYNNIIIVIQTNMSVLTYYFITERF